MQFNYRLYFELSRHASINENSEELKIEIPGLARPLRAIARGNSKILGKDSHLFLTGGPFDNKAEAEQQANEAYRCLLAYGLHKQVGIDLGLYSPTSVLTEAGIKFYEERIGQRVFNHHLGISIFEGPPDPVFIKSELTPRALYSADGFVEFFQKHFGEINFVNEDIEFAIHLYSLGFWSGNLRAQSTVWFMCLDIIIERQKREKVALNLIEGLIRTTKQSKLSETDKAQICGNLATLELESFRSAGKRLAADMDQSLVIGDKNPSDLFDFVHSKRAKIIHGSKVTTDELRILVDALGQFVSALLKHRLGLA